MTLRLAFPPPSTAEVMTIALVAAAFFGSNIEASRSFLEEYGYIEKAISKSRFNRRLHAINPYAINPCLWKGLFDLLAEVFKQCHPEQTYVVDSLPVCRWQHATTSAFAAASSILRKSTARLAATWRANGATSTGYGSIW